MKKQTYSFEEDYFEGYYKGIGDFSLTRNKELSNWFRGIFHYLNRYLDLKNPNKRRVLEFGCATGSAASVLSGFGFEVAATDISHYAVKKAKKIYPQIKFFTQDMQKPLRLRLKFDLAFSFDVIEHLEEPEKAIKNMYFVLKQGGMAICSTPNESKYSYADPSHINVKKPEIWRRIFKKIGFSDIIIRQVTFIPYFYRWHWRFNIALPIGLTLPFFISPVFIIAKK